MVMGLPLPESPVCPPPPLFVVNVCVCLPPYSVHPPFASSPSAAKRAVPVDPVLRLNVWCLWLPASAVVPVCVCAASV